MTELALFGSTFVLVFALGLQSLNVNAGYYWWAFCTSFVIGASNLVLYKLAPNATAPEALAYLAGGPFGIVVSMWVHRRWIRPRGSRSQAEIEFEERVLEYARAKGSVTTRAILGEALGIAPRDRTIALAEKVAAIMQNEGWVHCRTGNPYGWSWLHPSRWDK